MNITIKRLTEDDWLTFSQVRLKALQTDPAVFGSNYEKESQMTEAEWRSRFQPDDTAIFLIRENKTPIGVTCVGVDRNDPTGKSALFWGSWLAPPFRRKGLSELMYKARIGWAKQHPTIERLLVSHRASNLASKRANQKHGFVLTNIKETIWADGAVEDLVSYELEIKS